MSFSSITPDQEIVIKELNQRGNVKLMQDPISSQHYVKKELKAYNNGIYHQLVNEASYIKGLPKIYEINEKDDVLTVFEEYIPGGTMMDELKAGKIYSESETAKIIVDICTTVRKLHTLSPSVIHCDINPDNIMFRKDGSPILIDFTSAKRTRMQNDYTDVADTGDRLYISPEDAEGEYPQWESDVYSIGKLMTAMLTGHPTNEYFGNPRFKKIIEKCTDENPRRRYEDVYDLSADVSKVLNPNAREDFDDKWLPPGFRTHNVAHMIVASIYYGLITWASFTGEPLGPGLLGLLIGAFTLIGFFLAPVAAYCNYAGILDWLPGIKSRNPLTEIIARLVWGSIATTVLMIAVIIIGALLDLIFLP